MKLEEQVTSLEISKRLKELGVKQESLYGWRYKHNAHGEYVLWSSGSSEEFVGDESYSAFTVAELGEMLYLFGIIEFPFLEFYSHAKIQCWKFKNPFTELVEEKIVLNPKNEMTEAEARGKMLIYLLENKLV